MRFSSSTGAVPTLFGGEIARGKHLFPFRTEPLSLSAPMVLGGQPPGRVGRRRSLSRAAPRGGSFSFPTRRCHRRWHHRLQRTERPARTPPTTFVAARGAALSRWSRSGGDSLGNASPIVQRVGCARGEPRLPALTLADGLGLDPVLTERREVDNHVGRIEQPVPYVYEHSCHDRQVMEGVGQNPAICRGTCRLPAK